MYVRLGHELMYECPQPMPMLLMLNVHFSHADQLLQPDLLLTTPAVPIRPYRDGFGNWCSRLDAPAGTICIQTSAIIRISGKPDPVSVHACQHTISELPDEALQFLLSSRYCETELLATLAWQHFGGFAPGWPRVQAVCEFVHRHLRFDYMQARSSRTAFEAYNERVGVCRDFAHLGIAFCRALNIPARYCTGYLGDIGVPPPHGPMDFAGWFEAYLGGQWYAFDPRNLTPRIGRVLIARGRDAVDVALSTTFGPNTLKQFRVFYDELGLQPPNMP